MKTSLVVLFLFLHCHSPAQQTVKLPVLKKQLDSVMVRDQQYRLLMMEVSKYAKKDSVARLLAVAPAAVEDRLWALQDSVDELNLAVIEKIIAQYGYPGRSLVDTPTNETAWYVIQHSRKIGQYLPLIKKAGEQKELTFRLVAMMEDRYLMEQGKEQVYGTQGSCKTKDGQNNCFIWPVKDPATLNERRKKAGFSTTIEEYARQLLGIEYKVIALKDLPQ
jgi:hypothetical protein